MTLTNLFKTPWPWFGGKSDAAPIVWAALGDVDHYVEPFAGSLAVLLRRPHEANRTYHSETVNDFDGLLCNAWRAIAADPDAVAEAASWPVCEADLHARHLALLAWRSERTLERLMADPAYYDAKMAGWWVWGQSSWIGSGWCSGDGPWVVGDDGRIFKRPRSAPRDEPGVRRKLPHLGDDGKGVNHAGAREPGVERKRPHISDDGRGVNRPQAREPGVKRQRPQISNNGQGVNHAGAREPGVRRKRPHIGDNGQGVNHAGAREPGVHRKRPHIGDDGMGVNHAGAREPGVELVGEYHPMTMPEIRRWLRFLSARLRHVRVLNGDWSRACTSGALQSLPVRSKNGAAGVFLDPPYSGDVRDKDLYASDDHDIATKVREWCVENGANPRYRIVLAGFDTEHAVLVAHGWREVEWYAHGFLKGGMGNVAAGGGGQQKRERLWLSPHCLGGPTSEATAATPVAPPVAPPASSEPVDPRQIALFGGAL